MKTPHPVRATHVSFALLGLFAIAFAAVVTRAADIVPMHPIRAGAPGHPGTVSEAPPPAAAPNPQVQALDQQIKAMRDEYHGQLDPLQAQVKALREKYDPQIQSLVDQRYTLVEQGKSPALQDLDAKEKADLAALADREKGEIDGVHQRFSDQRKDLQKRYAEQRKILQGGR